MHYFLPSNHDTFSFIAFCSAQWEILLGRGGIQVPRIQRFWYQKKCLKYILNDSFCIIFTSPIIIWYIYSDLRVFLILWKFLRIFWQNLTNKNDYFQHLMHQFWLGSDNFRQLLTLFPFQIGLKWNPSCCQTFVPWCALSDFLSWKPPIY